MPALELISQAEAIAQLRLDEGDSNGVPDSAWLTVWIPAVSEAVRSWLKEDARLYVPLRDTDGNVVIDSSGEPVPEEDSSGSVVNPLVKAAVLIELASQYRYREGEGENAVPQDNGQYGYILSAAATGLLRGLRKPTVV